MVGIPKKRESMKLNIMMLVSVLIKQVLAMFYSFRVANSRSIGSNIEALSS